jgi:hypothetical protein
MNIKKALLVVAGCNDQLIERCGDHTKNRYAGLGAIFLLNYLILVCVWSKVGFTYFGPFGLVAPGVLVPSLFLALDRLVAMRPRKLRGELEAYDVGASSSGNEVYLRIWMAIVLSIATTTTFLIDQSKDLIEQKKQSQSTLLNKDLKNEYIRKGTEALELEISTKKQLLTSLESTLTMSKKELWGLGQKKTIFEAAALNAEVQAQEERGGLNGKVQGCQDKCLAQLGIAHVNRQALNAAIDREIKVELVYLQTEEKINPLTISLKELLNERSLLLESVTKQYQADERYRFVATGLFADATTFLALYADENVGNGMWLFTAIIMGLMSTLELAVLLGLCLLPTTTYDTIQIAENRLEASRHVCDAEIGIIQQQAKYAPFEVEPNTSIESNPSEELKYD